MIETPVTPSDALEQTRADSDWQLSVEWIVIWIRWFGLIVGTLLMVTLSPPENRVYLSCILLLGAVYAACDTYWHQQGQVFLYKYPLFTSLMEAIFIGLLCLFDRGLDSPFRYYYFLSLLVCAIRYSKQVTSSTFALHTASFSLLPFALSTATAEQVATLILMIIFMGWATWASTSLIGLMRKTAEELSGLNQQLEQRIDRRTRELQQSQAMLVQQEKQAAFGLLAAGIAHEVGNPLAAISSLVQMMNRKELDPQMHERLGLIDEQLLRIQRTLRELVEFSRPSMPAVSQFDLHDVIGNALNIAKYYKRKKGKTIVTNFEDGLPPILAIRDQVLQVFLNLILNAMDATEEGGTIEITTSRVSRGVQIAVKDNGSGIVPSDQLKLFEPYFTTKSTGTGLGLFICRNMLEASGGSIRLVRSVPGETTFAVTLPETATTQVSS